MTELIGNIRRDSNGYRVVFELDSRVRRRDLWHAIHNREALAGWLGRFSADLEPGTDFEVGYLNDTNYHITGRVTRAAVEQTLEYQWNFGEYPTCTVRFDLEKGLVGGTRLHLTVTGLDNHDVIRAASTWHAQLEFLRLFLAGEAAPAYALRFRRDELAPTYAAQIEAMGSQADNATAPEAPRPAVPSGTTKVLHQHAYLA